MAAQTGVGEKLEKLGINRCIAIAASRPSIIRAAKVRGIKVALEGVGHNFYIVTRLP